MMQITTCTINSLCAYFPNVMETNDKTMTTDINRALAVPKLLGRVRDQTHSNCDYGNFLRFVQNVLRH